MPKYKVVRVELEDVQLFIDTFTLKAALIKIQLADNPNNKQLRNDYLALSAAIISLKM